MREINISIRSCRSVDNKVGKQGVLLSIGYLIGGVELLIDTLKNL